MSNPAAFATTCSNMDLERAAEFLQAASKCVVFTGAGMSADSGIQTFRKSSKGLWSGVFGGMALLFFGTPIAWKWTPQLAWKKYLTHFLGPIWEAEPHVGHQALATLEQMRFSPLPIITMNVDGLHQRAGCKSVAELHGSVNTNRCKKHGLLPEYSIDREAGGGEGGQTSVETRLKEMEKWKCPHCASPPRPNFVLFGEGLPDDEWLKATSFLNTLRPEDEDVLIVVGTTGGVYPAASLPERALRRGIRTIEINMHRSPLSHSVDVYLEGKARDVLPALIDRALGNIKKDG